MLWKSFHSFSYQNDSASPGTIWSSKSPHVNHFLEVFSHLIIQSWWNPPILFLISLAPSFRVILCFTIEIHPRLRSSLAKASAHCLKMFPTSCWSLRSHSVHPEISTISGTSHSKVGPPSSNCRDIGVGQVNLFWWVKQGDWLTHDGSVLLKEGPHLHIWGLHIRDYLSSLHITDYSSRRNSDLLGR